MMALFKLWGCKQMWRVSLCFWGYVREDTHSIVSVTGSMILRFTISCSIFLFVPGILWALSCGYVEQVVW